MPENQFNIPAESQGLDAAFEMEKSKPMSFGMQLVGITFNPSGDEKVNKAKQLCAELANLVTDEFHSNSLEKTSFLKSALYSHTIGEILNAQMNCVKLLTLKY